MKLKARYEVVRKESIPGRCTQLRVIFSRLGFQWYNEPNESSSWLLEESNLVKLRTSGWQMGRIYAQNNRNLITGTALDL